MVAATGGDDLRAWYANALAEYVGGGGEEALMAAYGLGRRALEQGMGILEWAAVHHEALRALWSSEAPPRVLARAEGFFVESLSAFEMAQRGYVEANRRLQTLNADLRREVAEKERLAERLADSNHELESFSYSVAHDLRAPLRRVDGYSQALVEDAGGGLGEEARGDIGRIRASVACMTELIDALLRLAQAARVEPARQRIDLAARARAVVNSLRRADPARRVAVDIVEPLMADADPALVDCVLENLIGNAWKFTARKPEAHIQIGADPGCTPPAYFVRDDGAGFDMAHAHKLFGVFERLHSHEAFAGTGIGLATVQRVVRRHGGRIWAEGAVDRGATFRFTLEAPPAE